MAGFEQKAKGISGDYTVVSTGESPEALRQQSALERTAQMAALAERLNNGSASPEEAIRIKDMIVDNTREGYL